MLKTHTENEKEKKKNKKIFGLSQPSQASTQPSQPSQLKNHCFGSYVMCLKQASHKASLMVFMGDGCGEGVQELQNSDGVHGWLGARKTTASKRKTPNSVYTEGF